MDINVSLKNTDIKADDIAKKKNMANAALDKLCSGKLDMTGWVNAEARHDNDELERILQVADDVRKKAELMVVIGIGGSYMGAKAALEALPKSEEGIDVRFAGINFCSYYHRQLMSEMEKKETVLCVISKSGNTIEVEVAFMIMKGLLEKKYGASGAAERIIVINDKASGALRREANEAGYISFEVPGDIGGRYSATTAAGLFPMAVGGLDIRAIVEGEKAAAQDFSCRENAAEYAIARMHMMEQGKQVEAIEFYDSRLMYLGEWIKQLYGESEGKDGKGLFPVTLNFSTDLHSLGQFLQQGSQIFFETVISVDEYDDEIMIPAGHLQGKSMEDLNRAAMHGVTAAHRQAGIQIVDIHMHRLDSYNYGQLLYFLQISCAITAMMMNVDPFDQPGVEDYKREMRKVL